MACYVDAVRSYPGAGLRHTEFCHLLADTPAELHAMADRLGISRRFYQDHPWRWHHDLPEHLRARAVEFGALEMTMHEVGALLRARRAALSADHGRVQPVGTTADSLRTDAAGGASVARHH